MQTIEFLKNFLKDAGANKLFLTVFPSFCAIVSASNTFDFNITNGLIVLFAAILIQLSIQLFDDFIDWVSGSTIKRQELEQSGIRGLYTKSAYALNNKKLPRTYFYTAIIFFIIGVNRIFYVCRLINDYKLLLGLLMVILFGFVNYYPKNKKVMEYLGSEIFVATLCAPILMVSTFYACAKCIIPQIVLLSFILFFIIYYICLVGSTLNLKPDIMTQKTTLPIMINNSDKNLIILFFIGIIPFLLSLVGIIFEIIPKYSYSVFLLLPYYFWHFYLMYIFEKDPQKQVKWHFLMGEDSKKIENEHLGYSWYTVRYNFIRNIFIMYSIILAISITDFKEFFMF